MVGRVSGGRSSPNRRVSSTDVLVTSLAAGTFCVFAFLRFCVFAFLRYETTVG